MNIIFVLLAAVIFYFALSSIKLHFLFNEKKRLIELSYTLFKFRAELTGFMGKLYIAGICIKAINLKEMKSPGKSEPDKEMSAKKESQKKSVRLGFPNMEKIIYYLGKISYPIRKIRIKRFDIQISDGFSDPYKTGQLYALYSTVRGIFPQLMSHISFRPDFAADNIKIEGEGLVKLRIIFILVPVLQILTDKMKEFIKLPHMKIRKGTSYV